ncbi:MAG: AAA family ATPase [Acidimicrobiales bacterium]
MPTITIPGVYVEEVSFRSGIQRLETTGTAFVGALPAGPVEQPQTIAAPEQLDEVFGVGATDTATGQSLGLFFENRGHSPLVVRTGGSIEDALSSLPASIRLLVVPDTSSGRDALSTIGAAQAWAERTRAFYVLDPPVFTDVADLAHWLEANPAVRSSNSALYYPQLLSGETAITAGGAVAGIYVRTDRQRGVWKAPAGVEATVNGISGPAVEVTGDELATAGINPIRTVDGKPTVWGARTLSSDPEWRYVPTRRLTLLIEESIVRGTRWVVFEPNDEPLWTSIRAVVDRFLQDLWRDGALVGPKPEAAYFVRCGRDTMTQADIDAGRLIMEVGFAPLRPAEFVILRIEQSTSASANTPASAPSPMVQAARKAKKGEHTQLLFVGGTPTDKTATATALASAVQHPLYRVDLSQVVSKYIGETEKNLGRLFAEAEKAEAILFFDEADVLFGKRTRAKARHDRHANLETNYLLKLVEKYPGLVILALEHKPKDRQRRSIFVLE